MFRRILILAFLCICAGTLLAQDLSNIQIHGFVTQGFLYSTTNNLFTMNTSAGSAQWTDAAVSFTDALSDQLRVGVQLHVYQLGEIGGPNLQIDWASGDYRVNDKAGFVAGKIKTVFGLFNDSQDVDAVHLWVLLPESFYPVDNKSLSLVPLRRRLLRPHGLWETLRKALLSRIRGIPRCGFDRRQRQADQ